MIRVSRKGVELPINALIIIMLAVIVLAAALSIFTGVYNPGRETTTNIGSFNGACAQYSSAGCCGEDPSSSCTSLESDLQDAAEASNIGDAVATCCRSG